MASPAGVEERGQARVVRFGHARWDRVARRLTVRDQPVKLSWKAAECLNVLVEAGGEVVPKEELLQEVWGGGIVEESNLTQCISVLRKALDPSPDGGSHIGTAARVGYRLAVDVEAEQPEQEQPLAVVQRRRPWYLWAAACVLLLTAIAGAAVAYRKAERKSRAQALVEESWPLLRRSNLRDGDRATAMIRQALDLAPNYPPALAALAESSARMGKSSFAASINLARLALREDPNCVECEAVLGYVLATRGWQWKEAGLHLARAVKMDPSRLQWRLWYADWLAIQGRFAEALVEARAAERIDPADHRVYANLAAVHYLQGDYRAAVREGEKATALNRNSTNGHHWLYRSYLQLGEDVSAIIAHAFEVTSWASSPDAERDKLRDLYIPILEKEGRKGVGRAWIHEVREGTPLEVHRYSRAVWFMWIGEHENALTELEAAVRSKPYHVVYVAVDPVFAPLRGNKRFTEVERQVGLRLPS
jgi:DNA-binding winged helix-turn-helix (wHTH) protein/Flp pilus assembly protein TadD